jgi:uncharacterized membrane protein
MNQRFQAVDALRGLIMMLMAIDHASAFIARQHASEFWAGAMSSYSSAFPFLTRLVTHLCAPGFFFLLGASVYWSGSPRRAAWRGFVIVLVGQFLETPVMFLQTKLKPAAVSLNRITAPPPIDGSDLYWGLIVLTGLGLVMMCCALLLRLPRWTWWLTAALCIFATNTLLPADGKIGPLWQAILLTPGLSQHVFVIYPVIPWLAAGAAGMCFGYWWKANPDAAEKRVWLIGLAVLLVGVALRAYGGWGNIRPPRDAGWIEFLNNVKYPPSLVFLTLSLGVDLLLLALLIRVPVKGPFIVFGQTPLFFYVVHFYLLWVIGFLFFKEAASLEVAYVVWAAVLAMLYPVCVWYRRFKLGKPADSLWRMF